MILNYPVEKRVISQAFGEDSTGHPELYGFYTLFDDKHPGVDFAVYDGTNIFAACSGIVVRREFHKGMGNVIATRNGNIIALYAHLSKFSLNLSQTVKTGDKIGLSGNTGEATTEPHLHFEVRDLTKQTLKEMVFNPPFGTSVKQWSDKFLYKVNNKNTQKTLQLLARRYFGSERYWKRILKTNPKLNNNPVTILKEETEITIPNYPS